MNRRRISVLVLVLLFAVFFVGHAHADTIVQGFKAKGTLQPGMIVSLSGNSNDTVQMTAGNASSNIYGVVIDPSLAPVTVQQQGQQVFVATAGDYPVLVSTKDGVIKSGDYISMSQIDGVGAKASDQSVVLGRALESFDGKNNVITTSSDGHPIGRINVAITPGKNPLVKDNVAIPAPLKRFGQAIAGKNITAVRIWAALAVFAITAVIAISILVVGIRSGFTAIGRNPLSKKSIMKSLTQVVAISFLVFVTGVFGVYLLLKA